MVKVVFFHNECAPYRIPLFERVSKLRNVDLKVYFGRYRSSNRRWKADLNVSLDYEILAEIRVLSGLFSLFGESNPVNPSLFLKLLSEKCAVFMSGDPSNFGTHITFLVAKILRRPFILYLENIDLRSQKKPRLDSIPNFLKKMALLFYLIRSAFSCVVLRKSDAYVVPGVATREFLLHRGIQPSKIFTAVNAIDNELYERICAEVKKKGVSERLRKKLGVKGKKVILYVGYLEKRKGIQYLIEACAKLKRKRDDIALVIVGGGPYEQGLKRASTKNNISPIFTGYLNDLELISCYSIADVFVLPTLDDAWGFVINEAMVCGCPIVTTWNAGSSKDLVKNGINGFVVEPGNALELCEAIDKILIENHLRKRMEEKSRDLIKSYTYDKSKEGFSLAISKVSKGRL